MSDFKITVYFATNRNRIDGDECFGSGMGSHPALFRVGRAVVNVRVSVTSSGVSEESTRIRKIEVYEETPSRDGAGFDTLGTNRLVPKLAKAMRKQRADLLCVIPGFDYTFRESIERAALLAALYSKDKSPPLIAMVFSWPSDGSLSFSGYLNDWIDAYVSGPAIARAMDRLARLYLRQAGRRWERNNCGQRIHLVAHSMGAHALKHAVMVYNRLPGARMVRFFDTAILAAADTERDALERFDKMAPLARLAKSVHCYINPADKPLELADEIIDPPDRLGSYGPRDLTLAQKTFDTTPLSIINCSGADFWGQDVTRHQYYRMSPKVVSDIVEAIQGCQGDEFTHRVYDEGEGIYRI